MTGLSEETKPGTNGEMSPENHITNCQNILREIAHDLQAHLDRLDRSHVSNFLTYDLQTLMINKEIGFQQAFNSLTSKSSLEADEKNILIEKLKGKRDSIQGIMDLNLEKDHPSKLFPDGMVGIYKQALQEIQTILEIQPVYNR